MNEKSQKRITAAVIAGPIILASVAWYSLSGPVARTSNVTPGDTDYPIINLNPDHTIDVTLLMPASLESQLSALYTATLGRDAQTTPVACHFVASAQLPKSLTEYSVEIPVTVSLQGAVDHPRSVGEASYRATVAVDRFAAGRCHWSLDRVLYRVKGAATGSQLFHFDEEHPGYAMAGNGMLSTFWCKSMPGKDGVRSESCIGHKADPPDASRGDERVWPLRLGSDDTKVQIEFLDQNHLVAPAMVFP